jgi:hypothetical protein
MSPLVVAHLGSQEMASGVEQAMLLPKGTVASGQGPGYDSSKMERSM